MADSLKYLPSADPSAVPIGVATLTVGATPSVDVAYGLVGYASAGALVPVDLTHGFPTDLRQVGGVALTLGQKAKAASLPVALASDQDALTVSVSNGLALTLGQKHMAASVPVTLADDQAALNVSVSNGLALTLGQKAKAASVPVALASDQGPLDVSVSNGLALTLGQKAMTASMPVVLASDQGAVNVAVVSGSTGNAASSATGAAVPAQGDYSAVNVGGTLRGRTGVNPSGTVYAAQTDLASVGGATLTLGQKAKASSVPVALASDQGALDVAVTNGLALALGQQAAAASVPVVLTAAQMTALAPPSAVSITNPLPAGANLLGQVAAGSQTGQVLNGASALAVKFAFAAVTASGNTVVVAAVPGKKIRVLSYAYQGDTAAAVAFRSSTAGAISAPKPALANQPVQKAATPLGHFETAAGEALLVSVSAAQSVAGVDVVYVEV